MKKKYLQPSAETVLFAAGDALLNSGVVAIDEDFGSWPKEWGN